MSKLAILVLMVALVGCGTIRFDLQTDIRGADQISHDLDVSMSGAIVELMLAESDPEEEVRVLASSDVGDKCQIDLDDDTFRVRCTGLTQEELTGGGFPVEVEAVDQEDYWEYRASMVNEFVDTDDFTGGDFDLGIDTDDIVDFEFVWMVNMPGRITSTNADSHEGGKAVFDLDWGDDRSVLNVVSRQPKGGDCN